MSCKSGPFSKLVAPALVLRIDAVTRGLAPSAAPAVIIALSPWWPRILGHAVNRNLVPVLFTSCCSRRRPLVRGRPRLLYWVQRCATPFVRRFGRSRIFCFWHTRTVRLDLTRAAFERTYAISL